MLRKLLDAELLKHLLRAKCGQCVGGGQHEASVRTVLTETLRGFPPDLAAPDLVAARAIVARLDRRADALPTANV